MRTYLEAIFVAGGYMLALLLSGCDMGGAQPERTGGTATRGAADFATRRIEDVSLTQVQPIADRVFRSYFRLDGASSTATDLVAFPSDVTREERAGAAPSGGTEPSAGNPPPRETIGDVVGLAPRRYRRLAELRLAAAGNGVTTQVRVMLQRFVTTERTAFSRERGDDRPTDTPIDRLGSTATTSREEWRDYRRDRVMEREILNAIQTGLTTTQPSGG